MDVALRLLPLPSGDVVAYEFAFSLPDELRATAHEGKIATRRLAERLLPPSLRLDRKQGFSIPIEAWLAGELGRFVEAVLAEADPQLFDRQALRALLRGQGRGRSNSTRLFSLTMLELWRRRYKLKG
jgi:asparagine synthase (glutamine-hydrolysing)